MSDIALRAEVVRVCSALNEQRLTRGTSGNVSVRDGDAMLIMPSAVPFGELTAEMLVSVELDAAERVTASIAGATYRASVEWRMHQSILRARPDVNAVVHTHSTFATALSCMRRPIPAFHYMVAVAGGADIRCADYALYGSKQLATNALRALEDRRACLLANHGAIALGVTLADALALAIEVEALAEQYCHALAAGGPVLLSSAEMDDVLATFQDYRPPSPS